MTSQVIRPQSLAFALVTFLLSAQARADVYIYATGDPPAPPSNLNRHLSAAQIGSTGFFDVFVQADIAVTGISLDVAVEGDAIKLTDIEIPNYAAQSNVNRWFLQNDGFVEGNGKLLKDGWAFAIPPIVGAGINPPAPDAGYNPTIDAYHFARVSYEIVGLDTTEIFLQIGQNEIGINQPTLIYLGVGDPIFTANGIGTAGAKSPIPEIVFAVPEPAGCALAGLCLLVACTRRNNRPKRK